jgi:hypothetical protein
MDDYHAASSRITASRAKSEFHLNENELSQLGCLISNNIRLFRIDDVTAAYASKVASKPRLGARWEAERKRRIREKIVADHLGGEVVSDPQHFARLASIMEREFIQEDVLSQLVDDVMKCRIAKEAARDERHAQMHAVMDARRTHLQTALNDVGCVLRRDSRLCNAYINSGNGDVSNIVQTMLEMKFYVEHTTYPQEIRRRMYTYYTDYEDRELWEDDDDDNRDQISAATKKTVLRVWVEKYGKLSISRSCLPTSLKNTVRLEFCRQCFDKWADQNSIPNDRRIVVNQSQAETILESTVDAKKPIDSFDMWSLFEASERERNLVVVAALSKDTALIHLKKKERYSVICLILDEYRAYPAHAMAKMADPFKIIRWNKNRRKMQRVIVEDAAIEVDLRVRVIQRVWRKVIVDPAYSVCRSRLNREFLTLNID